MSDVFESERNDIVVLADSLKWIDSIEESQNVIMALLRVVSSCNDSRLSTSSVVSLSARLGCSVSLVRRTIYSLLTIRHIISTLQIGYEELSDSLQKLGLSVQLSNTIGEYVQSLHHGGPTLEISVARPSQYPLLTSVSARTEINIGTMALRHSPGVLVRVRFVIGESEKIVLLDAVTLQRCCQQLQNVLSNVLKL